jgi:hypothetical protein
MLPGESWGLAPEQQASWDSLPDCPNGDGKVNPHPDDPNYNPFANSEMPSAGTDGN